MGVDGAHAEEAEADRGGGRVVTDIVSMIEPAERIAGFEQKRLVRFFGVLLLIAGLSLIVSSIAEGTATKSAKLQIISASFGVVLLAGGAVLVGVTGRKERPEKPRTLSIAAGAPRIERYAKLVYEGYASAGVDGRLWAVTAQPGHGKSTLLELIGQHFRKERATVVSLACSTEQGASTFRFCEQLVEDISESLTNADAAYGSLADALLDTFKQYDMGDEEVDFGKLSRHVFDALAKVRGELVLLVDEVDAIVDERARVWLFALADRLAHRERRLVVLASRPGPDLGRVRTQLPLRRHSREEIDEEVRLRVTHAPAGCAEKILEYSAGAPFAVDTALRHFAAGLGAEALGGADGGGSEVRAIDSAARRTLIQLDEGAAARCGGGRAPRLADWLAVLEQFGTASVPPDGEGSESAGAFGEVLMSRLLVTHEGLEPTTADALIAWLIRQDHWVRPVLGYQAERYQLLAFLREAHLTDLRTNDPDRHGFLHAMAEREYWRIINGTDAEDLPRARLQEMQVRYEGSEWHRVTLAWLNHAFEANPNHKASIEAARSCSTLLFKRYFWYDLIAPTVQCKELISYYKARWPAERWVAALVKFYDHYISGPYAPGWLSETAHLPAWQNVEAATASLVKELGLPNDAAALTDDTRDCFIYISLLRADGLRFAHHPEEALSLWEQVRLAEPEEWILPWIDTLEAETRLETGEAEQVEQAARGIVGMEAKALSFNDNDLRMAAGVVRADVLWEQHDQSTALTVLTRALLVAAAYHLQQEVDNDKGEYSLPGMYSKLRHQHIAARLNARLAEVERYQGRPTRREWDTRIALFFQPYWDHWAKFSGRRAHSGSSLPPPPAMADLMDPDSNYCIAIKEGILRSMRKQLAEPLDNALPSAQSASA